MPLIYCAILFVIGFALGIWIGINWGLSIALNAVTDELVRPNYLNPTKALTDPGVQP